MTRSITRRLAQTGRLGRDLADVVRALARALLWTLRARAPEPGIAVLAGMPLARAGEPEI